MHSDEPKKARPEGVEGEVLSTFKMAGSQGNLRTVLTPDNVILERNSGNYLRLSYNKVEGMRHHQFHIIPHWLMAIGLLMIYSSLRILTGQVQLWIGVIGAGIIISWLGFRKSALTIDSGDAGNYTLFGPESDLIKFRLMTERIKDGIPFDEAKEGLDELVMSEYPSSGVFEELIETIDMDSPSNTDALTMAMTDLINQSQDEEKEEEIEHIILEEPATISRDPMHHGSIERARRVQTENRPPPAHSGWANVANRTEILRAENNNYVNSNNPQYVSRETIPSADEPFNLFGFNLEESDHQEESFNMFGESYEPSQTQNYDINEDRYPPSSFSMLPDSVQPQNNQFNQQIEGNPKTFLHSFQQTGYTNSLNQLGVTLEHSENNTSIKQTSEFEGPGIVSQAKGVEEVLDAEIVSTLNTEGLKRITLNERNKHLKRVNVTKSPVKRMSLFQIIKSSLKFTTPDFLRNKATNISNELNEELIEDVGPNMTMDALKIQAHQTHEAQLADALRKINDEENTMEQFLEDISPDLVEPELPSSFQELKSSNTDESNALSTTGVARLD